MDNKYTSCAKEKNKIKEREREKERKLKRKTIQLFTST